MLTRRNKEKLIFLILGVFIGIALSAIVAYFSIIAGFTKDNIVKVTNIFPTEALQIKANRTEKKQIAMPSKDTLEEQIKLPEDTTLIPPKEIIKSDVKIAAEVLPILWINDSNDVVATLKKEIQVEQWSSPMNFVGYKLSPDLLIIYGIDLENIELQYMEENIYLMVGEESFMLEEADNFVRFPDSFFK